MVLLALSFQLARPELLFLAVIMWFAGGITLSMFSHKHLMEGVIFFVISAILLLVFSLALGIVTHT